MRLTLCRQADIPRDELLRYARCRSDAGLEELVTEAIAGLRAVWEPRAAAVRLPVVREGEALYLDSLLLPGRSIARHLAGCSACWLLGVTLGFGVDRLIASAGQTSPSLSLLLDAAATAAVEDVADAACQTLSGDAAALTGRFSAGYGDLPLTLQPALLELLQARRELGVTTGSSLLLSPAKSVTALVGILEGECVHA